MFLFSVSIGMFEGIFHISTIELSNLIFRVGLQGIMKSTTLTVLRQASLWMLHAIRYLGAEKGLLEKQSWR